MKEANIRKTKKRIILYILTISLILLLFCGILFSISSLNIDNEIALAAGAGHKVISGLPSSSGNCTNVSYPQIDGNYYRFYHGLFLGDNTTVDSSLDFQYFAYNSSESRMNTSLSETSSGGVTKKEKFFTTGNITFSQQGSDSNQQCLSVDSFGNDALIGVQFNLSQNFLNLLNDHMVNVYCVPYVVMAADNSNTDTPDQGQVALSLHTVRKNNSVSNSQLSSAQITYSVSPENANNLVICDSLGSSGKGTKINGNYGNSRYNSDTFLQVSLYKFQMKGNGTLIFIREVGLMFTIEPNTNLAFDLYPKDIEVISNRGEYRNPNCDELFVTNDDIVNAFVSIIDNANNIVISNKSAKSDTTYFTGSDKYYKEDLSNIPSDIDEGVLYRYFYLTNNDETIVRWRYVKGEASIIEEVESTGQSVQFNVINGDASSFELTIQAYCYYRKPSSIEGASRNIEEYDTYLSTSFIVDSTSPNIPALRNNTFANSFLNEENDGDESYFTIIGEGSVYSTSNVDAVDYLILNSGNGDENNPRFLPTTDEESVLNPNNGSNIIVYYKTTYVGTTIPQSYEEISSNGFYPLKSNGTINNDNVNQGEYVGVIYDYENGYGGDNSIFVSMLYTDSNSVVTHRTNGIWAIEFVAYDYVGNRRFKDTKYFIKIDISDYAFTIKTITPANRSFAPESQYNVTYTTFSITGASSNGTAEKVGEDYQIFAKRGNFVLFNVVFLGTYGNNYVITSFKTTGYSLDCTNKEMKSRTVSITNEVVNINNTDKNYTFMVNRRFVKSSSATSRDITLTFKVKANVSAIPNTKVYDGTSKYVDIRVTANDGSGSNKMVDITNNVRVTTTYYVDEQKTQPISTNFPINAGTYYYLAEVKDNVNYYGKLESSMTIEKATPNISNLDRYVNTMQMIIPYGESLSMIDYNTNGEFVLVDGKYKQVANENINNVYTYYNANRNLVEVTSYELSSDGIPGYYIIDRTSIDDNRYNRPQAGTISFVIQFIPCIGTFNALENRAIFKYADEPEYAQYTDYVEFKNGYFYYKLIPDDNYNVASRNVTITIRHSQDNNITYNLYTALKYSANEDYPESDTSEHFVLGSAYKYDRYEYEYDGNARDVVYSVASTRQDELGLDLTGYSQNKGFAKIESSQIETFNVSSLNFVTDAPRAAGIYLVRIIIDTTRCNYENVFYIFLVINKRTLVVTVNESDFDYQHETKPEAVSRLGNAVYSVEGYTYDYYYYFDKENSDGELSAYVKDEYKVKESDLRAETKNPLKAGHYIVKVTISSSNYRGFGLQHYFVRKVDENKVNIRLKWPNITNSTYSQEYELSYGESLFDTRLITYGQYFRYVGRNYTTATNYTASQRDIDGTMILATFKYNQFLNYLYQNSGVDKALVTYNTWLDEKLDEYVDLAYEMYTLENINPVSKNEWIYNTYGEYGLIEDIDNNGLTYIFSEYAKFRLNNDFDKYMRLQYVEFMKHFNNFEIGRETVYLCYVPVDMVNFDFIYSNEESIRIGKAYIDFNNVSIKDITYEEEVKKVYNETTRKNELSITISKTLGVLYSNNGIVPSGAKLIDNTVDKFNLDSDLTYYYTVYGAVYLLVDSNKYEYDILREYGKLEAGNNGVNVVARFTEDIRNEYGSESSSLININVNKKELETRFDNDGQASITVKYNQVDLGLIKTLVNYTIEDTLIKYNSTTKVYTSQFGVLSGIITFKNQNDENLVYSENDTLPIGTYLCKFTLIDDNYIGECEFTMEVIKTSIKISSKPNVLNPTTSVYYNNLYTNVTLINGVAIEDRTDNNVNTVVGTFAIYVEDANKRFDSTLDVNYNKNYANIFFTFTPVDTTNYEVFIGSLENNGYIREEINRYDVSEFMSISLKNEVNEYGSLIYKDNRQELTEFYLDNVINYVNTLPEIDGLSVYVTIKSLTNSYLLSTLNAGRYEITLNLEETNQNINYKGKCSIEIEITKAPAYVKPNFTYSNINCRYIYDGVEGVKRDFTNKVITMSAILYNLNGETLVGQSLTLMYYKGAQYVSNPVDIGYYSVEVYLRDSINYRLVDENTQKDIDLYRTFLVIGVDKNKINIANLNQTYLQTKDLSINITGTEANYIIYYDTIGNTVFPKNAGVYDIYLHFTAVENNGYDEIVLAKDVKPSYVLNIDKYTSSIIAPGNVSFVYTGTEGVPFVCYTDPTGRQLKYSYKLSSADDSEYTEIQFNKIAALNAGNYNVKIELNEDNYKGQIVINLNVTGAAVTINAQPTLGDYVYNTAIKPTITGGSAIANRTNQTVVGHFDINLETINTLNVGIHSVLVTFIPDSSNYSTSQISVPLTIKKQELTEDFFICFGVDDIVVDNIFKENNYLIEYDGMGHVVNMSYDSNIIYSENKDIVVETRYNGTLNVPMQIGQYTIKVSVNSRNYFGEFTYPYPLVINKATPFIISSPTVNKTFKINDIIYNSDVLVGGKAIIKSTLEEISGTFSMISSEYKFTKANINNIKLTFTPLNTTLYNTVNFDMPINCIGKDMFTFDGNTLNIGQTANNTDWTEEYNVVSQYGISKLITLNIEKASNGYGDHSSHGVRIRIYPKSGDSLSYGAVLDDFNIEFVPEDETCDDCLSMIETLNECGTLKFAKLGTYVPKVGEKIEVVYTLFANKVIDQDIYNTMSGLISLNGVLTKKDVSTLPNYQISIISLSGTNVDVNNLVANIYAENKLAFAFDLRDNLNKKLYGYLGISEGLESLNPYTYTIEDEMYANLVFETQNYYLDTSVYVAVYTEFADGDIEILNNTKVYDGKKLDIKDFNLRINNTNYPVDIENYTTVICYNNNYEDVDGIDCGEYVVLIFVEDVLNEKYGCVFTNMTVTKRNISSEITISKTEDEYGSPTVGIFDCMWEGNKIEANNIEYKNADDDDAQYTQNIIFNAGKYNVRITVSNSNFVGVGVVEYVVTPKIINITPGQSQYVYTYGDTIISPTVSFTYDDGTTFVTSEYDIYFYSKNYSWSLIVPQYVGVYTCKVTIPDTNYEIRNPSFSLTINKALLTIQKAPKLGKTNEGYNLTYGQKLSELTILTDSENKYIVTYNDTEVDGIFAPKNPDLVLNAGINSCVLTFTPSNSNYANVDVDVSVNVSKAEAKVTIDQLVSMYNSTSRKNDLKYTVTPNIDVDITFVNEQQRELIDPIEAGVYTIKAVAKDSNYIAKINQTKDGKNPLFTIYKASVREIVKPTASSITVGTSLQNSILSGGISLYNGFNNSIEGTYSFIQNLYVFNKAGHYEGIEYRFVPENSNFDSYVSVVGITINKAVATIDKKIVTTTYGNKFDVSNIEFTTNPGNLKVVVNPTYDGVTYNKDDYIDAGTYFFSCSIEDDNYYSTYYELEFVVERKRIDIDFTDRDGNIVTTFRTEYGDELQYGYKIYDSTSLADKSKYLIKDSGSINNNITYLFTSRDNDEYKSTAAPKNIGTYNITVNLYHKNYYASNEATLRIDTGNVQNIEFDYDSLSNQIYGNVSAPIITTTPANVSYYIIYQGFDLVMPKDVGSYNIVVYINDPNYNRDQINAIFKINPRKLSVTDIFVEDKVYDGTSTLKISGRLEGNLLGDEIYLNLEASTYLNATSVGKHFVTITKAEVYGMDSSNYELQIPKYEKSITILNNYVKDKNSSSYVTSTSGLLPGTTIDFKNISSTKNKANVWSRLVGADADVIQYSIKVNDTEIIGDKQYKVSVYIPAKYQEEEFTINFSGNLSGEVVNYAREGNYISFYTQSANGEIVFSVSKFKYEYIIAASILAVVLISAIVLIILNPIKNRRNIQDPAAEKRARKYIRSRKY